MAKDQDTDKPGKENICPRCHQPLLRFDPAQNCFRCPCGYRDK